MKKIIVNKDVCIGCQMCAQIAADTFRMNEDNISEALNPPGNSEEEVQSAIDSCPMSCISWN